jgi:hypothetical protein
MFCYWTVSWISVFVGGGGGIAKLRPSSSVDFFYQNNFWENKLINFFFFKSIYTRPGLTPGIYLTINFKGVGIMDTV